MSKESFLMYLSFDSPAQLLTDAERGQLWTAVFEYARSGREIDLPLSVKIAFAAIRDHLARDSEKYQAICERNRENGKRGGRPKNPENPVGILETQRNPEKPKKAQSDSDNDSDSDSDNNTISSERSKDHSRTGGNKPKIVFNWETETFENITEQQCQLWASTYPAVDIQAEILKAAAWQASNPAKRKKDYKKFLNGWFSRQQERGGTKNFEPQNQGKKYYGI